MEISALHLNTVRTGDIDMISGTRIADGKAK